MVVESKTYRSFLKEKDAVPQTQKTGLLAINVVFVGV